MKELFKYKIYIYRSPILLILLIKINKFKLEENIAVVNFK